MCKVYEIGGKEIIVIKRCIIVILLLITMSIIFIFSRNHSMYKEASITNLLFPTVAMGDVRYEVTRKEVLREDLEKQVGKITKFWVLASYLEGDEPFKSPVGNKIYKIKELDPEDIIAVKLNDTYYKAEKILEHNGLEKEVRQNSTSGFELKLEITEMPYENIPPFSIGSHMEVHWTHLFVIYKGNEYEIRVNNEIPISQLGRKIGEVSGYMRSSFVYTGEWPQAKEGDSNYLRSGSPLYEYKGKDIGDSIIVEDRNSYWEAVKISK